MIDFQRINGRYKNSFRGILWGIIAPRPAGPYPDISLAGKNPMSVALTERHHKSQDFFFFRIGRSDLTKKLEKVGPFECDELEKHCRVSAKCYPTTVPALYTMTKEKFNSACLVLLLVS